MSAEVIAWLREREANARRIARGKAGEDAAGWLEDATYLRRAADALHECSSRAGRASEFEPLTDDAIDAIVARVRGFRPMPPPHLGRLIARAVEAEHTGTSPALQQAREALEAVVHYFWTAEREPGGLREWDVEGLVRGAIGALSAEMTLNTNQPTKFVNGSEPPP